MGPRLEIRRSRPETEGRLARAAFADDADGFAGADAQGYIVDCLDVVDRPSKDAGLDRVPDPEAFCGKHFGGVIRHFRRRAFGLRSQQAPGVFVLWPAEDPGDRSFLHNLAEAHHGNPVGEIFDNAQIVGNEQDAQTHVLLEVLQELEDRRLDRDIDGRGRFVGDQQIGLVGQRHRDHHPLALAARELVREGAEPPLRFLDADLFQQFQHLLAGGVFHHSLMDAQDFANLLFDRVQRVERRQRLLENHRNPVAADFAQDRFRGAHQFFAAEPDAAGRMARLRIGQELQDRQRRDRFTGPALPDQRKGLALVDVKGHAFDGMERTVLRAEVDFQVVNVEQAFGVHVVRPAERRGRQIGQAMV